MSEQNDKDLELANELFDFLQGKIPKGMFVSLKQRPKLTPDQAWTVIWYLGNQDWQVNDCIDRCDVCGDLYHSWQGGGTLDYGKKPYFFCDNCMGGEEYAKKDKRNPERKGV